MRYKVLGPLRWAGPGFIAALVGVALTLSAVGCSDGSTADDHAGEDHAGEHGGEHAEEHFSEIRFRPEQMEQVGITVGETTMGQVDGSLTAPGRIVPTGQGIAHVGTLVPGRVARIFVGEGAAVLRGAPLAEIESFGIGELKAEYLRAVAEVERSGAEYRRQQRLAEGGIGAQRNLEESKAAYEGAVASRRAAETKLLAAGISPDDLSSDARLDSRVTIRSPITGTIARRKIVLGEYLEPNRDAFEVVDNRTVWVDAEVPPTRASSLAVGGLGIVQDAERHRHSGNVTFISPTVDPESRMVTVRVELPNPDAHLRPEAYVTVAFRTGSREQALTVPRESLEKEGEDYYVYREHEPNTFVRVPVDVSGMEGETAVIRAGLKEGDRIATSGLFYLKSARQREELQEHDH